jgi:hypothetical protein
MHDRRSTIDWLLLAFTLPTKRASQRVEVWRKLQRYGTVPLGNSGYLLPSNPVNEERFQWLAATIRNTRARLIVHVQAIDNISTPRLIGRFAEARARNQVDPPIKNVFRSSPTAGCSPSQPIASRFPEIVEVDFFDSPLQKRVGGCCVEADFCTPEDAHSRLAKINSQDYKKRFGLPDRDQEWTDARPPGLFDGLLIPKAGFGFAPETLVPKGSVPFDMFHETALGIGERTALLKRYKGV